MRATLFWTFVCLVAVVAFVEPSFAQRNNPPAAAPAPLIGMGLPLAGLVLGAVWLVRRRLGRD